MYTIVQFYYKYGEYTFTAVENNDIKQFLTEYLDTWQDSTKLESITDERLEIGSHDLSDLIDWALEAGEIIIEKQLGFGIVGIIEGAENVHTLNYIENH